MLLAARLYNSVRSRVGHQAPGLDSITNVKITGSFVSPTNFCDHRDFLINLRESTTMTAFAPSGDAPQHAAPVAGFAGADSSRDIAIGRLAVSAAAARRIVGPLRSPSHCDRRARQPSFGIVGDHLLQQFDPFFMNGWTGRRLLTPVKLRPGRAELSATPGLTGVHERSTATIGTRADVSFLKKSTCGPTLKMTSGVCSERFRPQMAVGMACADYWLLRLLRFCPRSC